MVTVCKDSNVCFRKSFADLSAQSHFIVRLVTAAIDEALNRIEQFHPIFQRRFGNGLPDIVTLFALEKFPVAPDVLRIDLQLHAIFRDPLPTDFSFWHFYKSIDATAIAAMPSSRPMKPIFSFVVALMPIFSKLMPSASAIRNFISLMCG